MNEERPALSRDELRTMLRAAGLRCTAPRVAVLQQLHRAVAPLSHADLALLLADEGFDRATIYRNLIDLTEAGLVSRADRGDHVWRFELRREERPHDAEHPHFVCTACGAVACLPPFEMPVPERSPESVIGRVSEIVLRGQCHDCI